MHNFISYRKKNTLKMPPVFSKRLQNKTSEHLVTKHLQGSLTFQQANKRN